MMGSMLFPAVAALAWGVACWGAFYGAAVLIERRTERRQNEQRENEQRRAQLRSRLFAS